MCGRAESVPEGVAGVQGPASVHGAARGRGGGQSGAVRWPALLHGQGASGKLFYVLLIVLRLTGRTNDNRDVFINPLRRLTLLSV